MQDYVWYASYGSNLSEDRFMCYIKGGKPAGAKKIYEGCSDKSNPVDQKAIEIPHELYFAKSAQVWSGGGVCFINPQINNEANTLAKMYLITKSQFIDVVKQENKTKQSLNVDFNKVKENKSLITIENSWYGNLLHLGNEEHSPIFTFTNQGYLHDEINSPNHHYLKTIIRGLVDSHKLSEVQIVDYLSSKKGVSKNQIHTIITEL